MRPPARPILARSLPNNALQLTTSAGCAPAPASLASDQDRFAGILGLLANLVARWTCEAISESRSKTYAPGTEGDCRSVSPLDSDDMSTTMTTSPSASGISMPSGGTSGGPSKARSSTKSAISQRETGRRSSGDDTDALQQREERAGTRNREGGESLDSRCGDRVCLGLAALRSVQRLRSPMQSHRNG